MEFSIKTTSTVPKFQQIADQLEKKISSGSFVIGDKLPSIDYISQQTGVARQTVVQAYKYLKLNGMIQSSKTRGFYVQNNRNIQLLRVMVLFNIMSASKEIIYHAIENELEGKARIELFFHNYNAEIFESIIRSRADMFHYFIVMPHHDANAIKVLQQIPPDKLILIDRPLSQPLEGVSSIHQDFKNDVYEALLGAIEKIAKYKKIVLLFPDKKNLPPGIKEGVKKFAAKMDIPMVIEKWVDKKMLSRGRLFITSTDEQLIHFIELQQQTKLQLGKDIGLISYNESPLKRILSGGIATLSSDFEKMGETAAHCILEHTIIVTRNPFKLTLRNSL